MSMKTTTDEIDATERKEEETDQSTHETSHSFTRGTDDVVTYLQWGTLLAFVVLAVVAGNGLYSGLHSVIDVWVASEYQPVAQTGLNLGLLAAAISGIVFVTRRL